MQSRDEIRTSTGHTLHFEDDLTVVQFNGDLTLSDAEQLCEIYEQALQRLGYLLLLVDIDGAAGASSEARRKLVLWAQPHGSAISAGVYGGSILVRSFMKLMNGAVRLLSGKQSSLEFFGSEAEARRFLMIERARLQPQALIKKAEVPDFP